MDRPIRKGLQLRMTEELREQIERSAKHRGVSMNAEICWRLGASFREDLVMDRLRTLLVENLPR